MLRRPELVPLTNTIGGIGWGFLRKGTPLGRDRRCTSQEVYRNAITLSVNASGKLPHLEYRVLEDDDPNFLGVKELPGEGYRILIDKSQEEIVAKLEELKSVIENGDLKSWEFQGMKAVWFAKHLYQPLLFLDSKIV